jgi:hypothetical protein
MRAILSGLIAAATLATAAAPAAAQTAADKGDARCILVLALASREPKNATAAGQGTFFFLGRMAARGTSARMGPIMIAESKTITTPAQVQAELTRCSAELNARNTELRGAMGQLQAAGKAAAAAAKPAGT